MVDHAPLIGPDAGFPAPEDLPESELPRFTLASIPEMPEPVGMSAPAPADRLGTTSNEDMTVMRPGVPDAHGLGASSEPFSPPDVHIASPSLETRRMPSPPTPPRTPPPRGPRKHSTTATRSRSSRRA